VLAKKFQEAWNNNDASALAALFTEDAVLVNDSGPVPQTNSQDRGHIRSRSPWKDSQEKPTLDDIRARTKTDNMFNPAL
jgi:uncharacterized protein (TIGR02246 family)